jgi:hypothetical protein
VNLQFVEIVFEGNPGPWQGKENKKAEDLSDIAHV